MTMLLAVIAGIVTAVASWAILRSGERDEDQLARALGIERVSERRARPSLTRGVDLVARLAPEALVAALGGLTPAMRDDDRRRTRALVVLLWIGVLALVPAQPLWFFATIAVPRTARAMVEAETRAERSRARRELDREVTTAIDTFVLALEAGLPFERAVAAYAETVETPLARELAATVRELEVGYRRREALERLVTRTRSENLAALAGAVRLAEDFGTPLAQALRALAVEMRATRRQRLQEAALRAPVTMLLPTAGFILLPIFAIVLGPIALRLASGSLF
ncbi:MAG: hypothetical protein AUH85_18290 [Chloroflexi bacterium 13_1_40CM_4_68_4]|nr:MAG: hypothetical protein AUH85_18290 [Chloroflexi bacterium 13_1_40CM_4_68_4]